MKNLSFKKWCDENRWNTTRLAKEFDKYGRVISPTTIWYWQKGMYSPRDKATMDILSDICGFNARKFIEFKK